MSDLTSDSVHNIPFFKRLLEGLIILKPYVEMCELDSYPNPNSFTNRHIPFITIEPNTYELPEDVIEKLEALGWVVEDCFFATLYYR